MPATQAFGEFAVQLRAGSFDPLPLIVGDLETRRDFIDVRDVARALIAISLRGKPGLVYHVGTGQSRSVGEGLEHLIQMSGRLVRTCIDPSRHHRKSPVDSRADIKRIATHTGWTPAIPFEQSLADLWEELVPAGHGAPERTASLLPLTA